MITLYQKREDRQDKKKDIKESRNRGPPPLIVLKTGPMIGRKANHDTYDILKWCEHLDQERRSSTNRVTEHTPIKKPKQYGQRNQLATSA